MTWQELNALCLKRWIELQKPYRKEATTGRIAVGIGARNRTEPNGFGDRIRNAFSDL